MNPPTYQRIADDLRRQILDGRLPQGTRIPSRNELAQEYRVSDRVAVEAVRLLTAEGFVEGRPGSGTYVRSRSHMRRILRNQGRRAASPFDTELEPAMNGEGAGPAPSWRAHSMTATASAEIAERLNIDEGAEVMRTEYAFADEADDPLMLTTSWEPLAVTGGTPILYPEEGPHGKTGVVERMAVIGVTVTRAVENVTARPVLETEAKQLDTPWRSVVVVIQRTYLAGERPVETADIVVPTDRYEISYSIPIGEG